MCDACDCLRVWCVLARRRWRHGVSCAVRLRGCRVLPGAAALGKLQVTSKQPLTLPTPGWLPSLISTMLLRMMSGVLGGAGSAGACVIVCLCVCGGAKHSAPAAAVLHVKLTSDKAGGH